MSRVASGKTLRNAVAAEIVGAVEIARKGRKHADDRQPILRCQRQNNNGVHTTLQAGAGYNQS
eukprot:scaffold251292_cov21-Prasinocladus_malaysianus.AAC.3